MKDFLRQIVLEAGRISLDYRTKLASLDIRRKSPKNMVTEADLAIEKFLVDQIQRRFPDHAITGEESGNHGTRTRYRWLVDPIDGTNSFIHEQPFYSTSIALEKDGQVVMGTVYAPVLGELFFAELGQGAMLNDRPIRVSGQDRLRESILGTGFACLRDDLERNNLPYLTAILPKIRDIRRYGSVAIDLSYVACGRMDAFWELNLNLYDIAAGRLILEEAGGRLTDFSCGPDKVPAEVAASNRLLHGDLIALLSQVASDMSA